MTETKQRIEIHNIANSIQITSALSDKNGDLPKRSKQIGVFSDLSNAGEQISKHTKYLYRISIAHDLISASSLLIGLKACIEALAQGEQIDSGSNLVARAIASVAIFIINEVVSRGVEKDFYELANVSDVTNKIDEKVELPHIQEIDFKYIH